MRRLLTLRSTRRASLKIPSEKRLEREQQIQGVPQQYKRAISMAWIAKQGSVCELPHLQRLEYIDSNIIF